MSFLSSPSLSLVVLPRSIQHSPQGHTQQQTGRKFFVNPIGALFPVTGPTDSSGLGPATGGPPGPELGQMAASNITVAACSIRVFLLIENRLLRESLVRLLRNRCDLLLVGQSGHSGATARGVLDSQCDVLVIDSLQTRWFPTN